MIWEHKHWENKIDFEKVNENTLYRTLSSVLYCLVQAVLANFFNAIISRSQVNYISLSQDSKACFRAMTGSFISLSRDNKRQISQDNIIHHKMTTL